MKYIAHCVTCVLVRLRSRNGPFLFCIIAGIASYIGAGGWKGRQKRKYVLGLATNVTIWLGTKVSTNKKTPIDVKPFK